MKKFILLSLVLIVLFGSAYYVVSQSNKSSTNKIVTKSDNKDNSTSEKEPETTDDTNNGSTNSVEQEKVKAIDFTLSDISGKKVTLSELKGKKVFLNFWATWCPPCKAEMPDIEKLYQETKDSDLVILAVNLGESKDLVSSFLEKNKYNFPVLLDTTQNVAEDYQIRSIPTSYFIDEEGYIRAAKIGAMDMDEMKYYVGLLQK